MIPTGATLEPAGARKPRASGDDPNIIFHLMTHEA